MRKYFVFVLLIIGILFIDINGVWAVPSTETDDGGAGTSSAAGCSSGIVCSYKFCGLRGSASDSGYLSLNCPQNTGFVYMDIIFRCSDSSKNVGNCDSFVSWAYAYKNTDGKSCYSINSWGNYDYLFHNTDNYFGNYFKSNGSFKCPTINVALTNTTSDDTYTIGYKKPTDMKFDQSSQEGVQNNINWLNMPSSGREFTASAKCINSSTNLDEIDSSTKAECDATVQNKVESDIEQNKENLGLNGEIVDTSKITEWAQKAGYDIDSLGDPCSIISPSLKKLLSSAFWIISVGGIILVVVMTAISFIKAITASDDEKLRDAVKHLATRIIVVIILLLLPMLLTFIINLINNAVGDGEVAIGKNGEVFCDIDNSSSD